MAVFKDPSVLELFFHTSEDQGAANFLLFSLLIPYTHRWAGTHLHTHRGKNIYFEMHRAPVEL